MNGHVLLRTSKLGTTTSKISAKREPFILLLEWMRELWLPEQTNEDLHKVQSKHFKKRYTKGLVWHLLGIDLLCPWKWWWYWGTCCSWYSTGRCVLKLFDLKILLKWCLWRFSHLPGMIFNVKHFAQQVHQFQGHSRSKPNRCQIIS
jgi:hypothetical protein